MASPIDLGLVVTTVDNATRGIEDVDAKVNKLGETARNTEDRLRAIQVVLASIAVGKAIELSKNFLETAASIEQSRLKLTLLTGSYKEAGRELESLNEKFGGTGLNVDILVKQFVALQKVGLPIDKVNSLIEGMANLTLAGGNNEQALDTIGTAIVKMAARGTVEVGALADELTRALPEAMEVMAKAAGKNTAEFVVALKDQKYTADQVITFFIEGSKKYAGLVEQNKNTITGALAQIREAFSDNVRRFTFNVPIADDIVPRIKAIRDEFDDFIRGLQPDEVHKFFLVLDDVAAAAKNVLDAVSPLLPLVAKLADMFAQVVASLPQEAITAGLIGYLFFGRTGALIIGAIVSGYTKLTGETKSTIDGLVSYIDQALPFGLIGYMAGGKRGLLMFTAVAALMGYSADQIALLIARMVGNKDFEERLAKGQGALEQFKANLDRLGITSAGVGKKVADNIATPITQAMKDTTAEMQAASAAIKQIESSGNYNLIHGTAKNGDHALGAYGVMSNNLAEWSQQYLGYRITENQFLADKDAQDKIFIGKFGDLLKKYGTAENAARAWFAGPGGMFKDSANDGLTSVGQYATKFNALFDRMLGKTKDLQSQGATTAKMWEDISSGLEGANHGDMSVAIQGSQKYQENLHRVQEAATGVDTELKKIQATVAGDQHGEKVEEISKRYDELQKKIVMARDAAQKLQDADPRKAELMEKINQEQATLNSLKGDELGKWDTQYGLMQRVLTLQQQATQNNIQQKLLEISQQYNNGILFNLRAGTSGGQAEMQVEQQKLQLKQQILNADIQIAQLREKLLTTDNPQLIAQINQTIGLYGQLKNQATQAMQGLSASAVLANQFWKSVGQTIEQGVGNAIYGVVSGTMTLQQAGLAMYQSLLKAASDYIAKLLLMKLLGSATSMFGGGGLFGGMLGFANGGVIPGGVKPYANGGIIGGPTLFGLAGEAGTEAIMPLERVGGKLGVRTVGGGGGDMHVHLNALDTKTGLEYLYTMVPDLQAMFTHRARLNRGSERQMV